MRKVRLIYFFPFLLIQSLAQFKQQQQSLQCGSTLFNKITFDPSIKPNLMATTKLIYVPINDILNGVNICQRVNEEPKFQYSFTNYQQFITLCVNCTTCASGLSSVYNYFQRLLKDVKSFLIVIVQGVNQRAISNMEGEKRVRFAYVEDDVPITMDDCQIVDAADGDALRSFSKTSVLFVSISFIILMVISLAWLVFYYVQRFRYAHAKDRLQRRLFNAAKKALTRIPTRQLRYGDKELESDCPVCIDPYRTGDLIRCLPCRHIFHKTCVDPWLLEHRTCPMCKSDILKAFGYHVSVSRRAPVNNHVEEMRIASGDADRLSVDVHSTGSENAFPFQNRADSHDPFSFTPSSSSQLVQVMHNSNASAFSIIPLTVHSIQLSPHQRDLQSCSSYGTRENSVRRTRKGTWHVAPMGRSTGHLVNLVHVRSRSLSNMTLAECDRPTATFRSHTFGAVVAPAKVSSHNERVVEECTDKRVICGNAKKGNDTPSVESL